MSEASTTQPTHVVHGANDERAGEPASPCDPHVARALRALRAEPARAWTVAALARVSGLSRAAFARHFTSAVGVSPLRWLMHLRLTLAQRQLSHGDATLSEIAAEVGYSSAFALTKAFKRELGIAPGELRRRHRQRATAERTLCLAAA